MTSDWFTPEAVAKLIADGLQLPLTEPADGTEVARGYYVPISRESLMFDNHERRLEVCRTTISFLNPGPVGAWWAKKLPRCWSPDVFVFIYLYSTCSWKEFLNGQTIQGL